MNFWFYKMVEGENYCLSSIGSDMCLFFFKVWCYFGIFKIKFFFRNSSCLLIVILIFKGKLRIFWYKYSMDNLND